ncbi:MAG TPA: hypothetical protein VJM50_20340 [Pyrinomonadaceae bacterium]|nr:hypothetical protein [Pyrinomonadaceae bacterium]
MSIRISVSTSTMHQSLGRMQVVVAEKIEHGAEGHGMHERKRQVLVRALP